MAEQIVGTIPRRLWGWLSKCSALCFAEEGDGGSGKSDRKSRSKTQVPSDEAEADSPQSYHEKILAIRRQQEAIAKAAMGVTSSKRPKKHSNAHVPLRSGDAERLLNGETFAAVMKAYAEKNHATFTSVMGTALWDQCRSPKDESQKETTTKAFKASNWSILLPSLKQYDVQVDPSTKGRILHGDLPAALEVMSRFHKQLLMRFPPKNAYKLRERVSLQAQAAKASQKPSSRTSASVQATKLERKSARSGPATHATTMRPDGRAKKQRPRSAQVDADAQPGMGVSRRDLRQSQKLDRGSSSPSQGAIEKSATSPQGPRANSQNTHGPRFSVAPRRLHMLAENPELPLNASNSVFEFLVLSLSRSLSAQPQQAEDLLQVFIPPPFLWSQKTTSPRHRSSPKAPRERPLHHIECDDAGARVFPRLTASNSTLYNHLVFGLRRRHGLYAPLVHWVHTLRSHSEHMASLLRHVEEHDLVLRVLFGGLQSRHLELAEASAVAVSQFCHWTSTSLQQSLASLSTRGAELDRTPVAPLSPATRKAAIASAQRKLADRQSLPSTEGRLLHSTLQKHRWWLLVGGRWKLMQTTRPALSPATADPAKSFSYKDHAQIAEVTAWLADNDCPWGLSIVLEFLHRWSAALSPKVKVGLLSCFVQSHDNMSELLFAHIPQLGTAGSIGTLSSDAGTQRSACSVICQEMTAQLAVLASVRSSVSLWTASILERLLTQAVKMIAEPKAHIRAHTAQGDVAWSEDRCMALKFMASVWLAFPDAVNAMRHCVQSVIGCLKTSLREKDRMLQATAVSTVFSLIDGCPVGAATAMYLIRMIMYVAVIDLYGCKSLRSLVFSNVAYILSRNVDFPVGAVTQPLSNAMDQYGYMNTDFDLVEALVRHQQFQPCDAAILLSTLLNIAIHDSRHMRMASALSLNIIKRFAHSPLVHELLQLFCVKTVRQLLTGEPSFHEEHAASTIAAIVLLRLEPLNARMFAALTSEASGILSASSVPSRGELVRSILESFPPHHQVVPKVAPKPAPHNEHHEQLSSEEHQISDDDTASSPLSRVVAPRSPAADEQKAAEVPSPVTGPVGKPLNQSPKYSPITAEHEPVDAVDQEVSEHDADEILSSAASSFQQYRSILLRVFKYFAAQARQRDVPRKGVGRPEWSNLCQIFELSQPNHQAAKKRGLLTPSQALEAFEFAFKLFGPSTSKASSYTFTVDFPQFLALLWIACRECVILNSKRWTFSCAHDQIKEIDLEWRPDAALAHAACAHMFDTAVGVLLSDADGPQEHRIPLQASLAFANVLPPQYSAAEMGIETLGHTELVLDLVDEIVYKAVGVHVLPPIDRSTRTTAIKGLLQQFGTSNRTEQSSVALAPGKERSPRKGSHLRSYMEKRRRAHNEEKVKQLNDNKLNAERKKKMRKKQDALRRKNKLKLEHYMKEREESQRKKEAEAAAAAREEAEKLRRAAAAEARRREKRKAKIAEHKKQKNLAREESREPVVAIKKISKKQLAKAQRKKEKLAAWRKQQAAIAEAAAHQKEQEVKKAQKKKRTVRKKPVGDTEPPARAQDPGVGNYDQGTEPTQIKKPKVKKKPITKHAKQPARAQNLGVGYDEPPTADTAQTKITLPTAKLVESTDDGRTNNVAATNSPHLDRLPAGNREIDSLTTENGTGSAPQPENVASERNPQPGNVSEQDAPASRDEDVGTPAITVPIADTKTQQTDGTRVDSSNREDATHVDSLGQEVVSKDATSTERQQGHSPDAAQSKDSDNSREHDVQPEHEQTAESSVNAHGTPQGTPT